MREIKFRGKSVIHGQWVFGQFLKDEFGKCYIVRIFDFPQFVHSEVLIETVCQYIGIQDKNGKDIYEGDIDKKLGVVQYFTDLGYDGSGGSHPGFYFYKGPRHGFESELDYHANFQDFEIAGNIHENPELLNP